MQETNAVTPNKWLCLGQTPEHILSAIKAQEKLSKEMRSDMFSPKSRCRDYVKIFEGMEKIQGDLGLTLAETIIHFGHSRDYWRVFWYEVQQKVDIVDEVQRRPLGVKGACGYATYRRLKGNWRALLKKSGLQKELKK